jgi:hypothetical protein
MLYYLKHASFITILTACQASCCFAHLCRTPPSLVGCWHWVFRSSQAIPP